MSATHKFKGLLFLFCFIHFTAEFIGKLSFDIFFHLSFLDDFRECDFQIIIRKKSVDKCPIDQIFSIRDRTSFSA